MLQRLVSEAVIRTEAERLWARRGKPDQTAAESAADWDLATRNAGETEAEARRLWEAKGSPGQSDVDQRLDWAAAAHTVRQRRLAEEERVRKGSPANQDGAAQAADWAVAADQLDIEELWERCDPSTLLPGENPAAVPARVVAAKTALAAKPGYQANLIDALLLHDHARSPRPFTAVATEDGFGLGGHIVQEHVRAAGLTADAERRKQSMRVVTHQAAFGGACPGQAGSFSDLAVANAAVTAALKLVSRWPPTRLRISSRCSTTTAGSSPPPVRTRVRAVPVRPRGPLGRRYPGPSTASSSAA